MDELLREEMLPAAKAPGGKDDDSRPGREKRIPMMAEVDRERETVVEENTLGSRKDQIITVTNQQVILRCKTVRPKEGKRYHKDSNPSVTGL